MRGDDPGRSDTGIGRSTHRRTRIARLCRIRSTARNAERILGEVRFGVTKGRSPHDR